MRAENRSPVISSARLTSSTIPVIPQKRPMANSNSEPFLASKRFAVDLQPDPEPPLASSDFQPDSKLSLAASSFLQIPVTPVIPQKRAMADSATSSYLQPPTARKIDEDGIHQPNLKRPRHFPPLETVEVVSENDSTSSSSPSPISASPSLQNYRQRSYISQVLYLSRERQQQYYTLNHNYHDSSISEDCELLTGHKTYSEEQQVFASETSPFTFPAWEYSNDSSSIPTSKYDTLQQSRKEFLDPAKAAYFRPSSSSWCLYDRVDTHLNSAFAISADEDRDIMSSAATATISHAINGFTYAPEQQTTILHDQNAFLYRDNPESTASSEQQAAISHDQGAFLNRDNPESTASPEQQTTISHDQRAFLYSNNPESTASPEQQTTISRDQYALVYGDNSESTASPEQQANISHDQYALLYDDNSKSTVSPTTIMQPDLSLSSTQNQLSSHQTSNMLDQAAQPAAPCYLASSYKPLTSSTSLNQYSPRNWTSLEPLSQYHMLTSTSSPDMQVYPNDLDVVGNSSSGTLLQSFDGLPTASSIADPAYSIGQTQASYANCPDTSFLDNQSLQNDATHLQSSAQTPTQSYPIAPTTSVAPIPSNSYRLRYIRPTPYMNTSHYHILSNSTAVQLPPGVLHVGGNEFADAHGNRLVLSSQQIHGQQTAVLTPGSAVLPGQIPDDSVAACASTNANLGASASVRKTTRHSRSSTRANTNKRNSAIIPVSETLSGPAVARGNKPGRTNADLVASSAARELTATVGELGTVETPIIQTGQTSERSTSRATSSNTTSRDGSAAYSDGSKVVVLGANPEYPIPIRTPPPTSSPQVVSQSKSASMYTCTSSSTVAAPNHSNSILIPVGTSFPASPPTQRFHHNLTPSTPAPQHIDLTSLSPSPPPSPSYNTILSSATTSLPPSAYLEQLYQYALNLHARLHQSLADHVQKDKRIRALEDLQKETLRNCFVGRVEQAKLGAQAEFSEMAKKEMMFGNEIVENTEKQLAENVVDDELNVEQRGGTVCGERRDEVAMPMEESAISGEERGEMATQMEETVIGEGRIEVMQIQAQVDEDARRDGVGWKDRPMGSVVAEAEGDKGRGRRRKLTEMEKVKEGGAMRSDVVEEQPPVSSSEQPKSTRQKKTRVKIAAPKIADPAKDIAPTQTPAPNGDGDRLLETREPPVEKVTRMKKKKR